MVQKVLKVLEGSRGFQRVLEDPRRFQKVLEGSRRFQKVLEGFRMFQRILRGRTIYEGMSMDLWQIQRTFCPCLFSWPLCWMDAATPISFTENDYMSRLNLSHSSQMSHKMYFHFLIYNTICIFMLDNVSFYCVIAGIINRVLVIFSQAKICLVKP